ncbi:hypothetical protein CkaCkLH20_04318 [Colletotrichum karsti]|uniref:Uncharacterized protein n=1 Tax=Colletotrichum karsti TaxID=1095194 RepID=A0A9P6LMD7_9PEZI|nr:uncharacterized protein CkaCkLH20_04318 [Colletotrichum karsti]KAF9878280.1 hypothetical protein CkaCkLH20_04318 [Colletotrichum karsti]
MPAIPLPRGISNLDRVKTQINALQNSRRDFEPPEAQRPGPHPALIFGCVAIVMAIVFATCVCCARRRMKKKQAQYQKLHNRISAASTRKNNTDRNGIGQGTFPGYQYDSVEGAYNYASGYHQSNVSDPDGPPPAYSSQPSSPNGGQGTNSALGGTGNPSMGRSSFGGGASGTSN